MPRRERAACAQLESLDLSVPPQTLVGYLEHAEKAIVALSRAMQGGAKLIVLDEVTAALPSPDAGCLHRSIRAARAKGVAFIYVSHRLEEVFDLCDRMTVLRDGRNCRDSDAADVSSDQVIEWIAGRSVTRAAKPVPGPDRRRRFACGRGPARRRDRARPLDIEVGKARSSA